MWNPDRVTLTISVDVNLEEPSGSFQTKETAQSIIESILEDAIKITSPHYCKRFNLVVNKS